jgi:Flp pilus assembly protein TadG
MLKFRNIIFGTRRGAVAFLRDSEGAVAFYVALIIVLLVAFVGIAVDFSRFYTTNSQAQAAADAAAIAAAYQLDGSSDAITRATLAAQGTPLVNNDQNFAEGDEIVQIAQLRFLHSLPPSDTDPITDVFVTTTPESARFVEVTTETLTQNNIFLTAVGANSGTTLAVAVAGYKSMVCRYPPLMMCNPYETASEKGFPIDLLVGKTLLAKTKEGGTEAWAPGDMGLLDPPTYDWDTGSNTGAKRVAEELAKTTPDQCFDSPVEIRPGQVDAMRNAINVRFDIWQNPFFGGGNSRKNNQFRPARNVTKGMIVNKVTTVDPTTGATSTVCTQEYPPVPAPGADPLAMALQPDDCFAPDGDFSNPVPCTGSIRPDRIGDGNWNRETYWKVNHGVALPATMGGKSRYETYLEELNSGVPNNAPTGEDGSPMCFEGTYPIPGNPDRRILYMAVINCIEEGPLTGSSNPNVGVKSFAKMFIIQPIKGGADKNIWLELIDEVKQGNQDGVLHDLVQLYR